MGGCPALGVPAGQRHQGPFSERAGILTGTSLDCHREAVAPGAERRDRPGIRGSSPWLSLHFLLSIWSPPFTLLWPGVPKPREPQVQSVQKASLCLFGPSEEGTWVLSRVFQSLLFLFSHYLCRRPQRYPVPPNRSLPGVRGTDHCERRIRLSASHRLSPWAVVPGPVPFALTSSGLVTIPLPSF